MSNLCPGCAEPIEKYCIAHPTSWCVANLRKRIEKLENPEQKPKDSVFRPRPSAKFWETAASFNRVEGRDDSARACDLAEFVTRWLDVNSPVNTLVDINQLRKLLAGLTRFKNGEQIKEEL